jgi:hypothetical protein
VTTKLDLYNGALLAIGSRQLASLTESRESRRALDAVYARGGVRTCLSAGMWNFAMRSAQLDKSPSIEPDFGLQNVFVKDDDWVRTAYVCCDEYFREPLIDYTDEAGHLYADQDPIYCKWVSDGLDYGGDLASWPENFTRYVEHWFAHEICERITQGRTKKAELAAGVASWLTKASSTDAMDEPTKFLPPGSWSRSRHRGMNGRRDRGPRTRFY